MVKEQSRTIERLKSGQSGYEYDPDEEEEDYDDEASPFFPRT